MKLLDLFCGAGGAGQGYGDAGFEVTGIDIEPQPDYPGTFIQADALEYLAAHGHEYDAIHASPPCQASSALTKGTNRGGRGHVDLIPDTRALLRWFGKPSVIENVPGADLRPDVLLCGEMFGLGVLRHRYFETEGLIVFPPAHPTHRGRVAGHHRGQIHDGPYLPVYGNGGGKGSVAQWQEAMGIGWTSSRHSLAQAIPPAYTRHIGSQLMRRLTTGVPFLTLKESA